MSRAGVHPDIAERVLGHVQQGVLGTYDRHAYKEEKREALRMLAGLVESILRNDADKKVRRLRGFLKKRSFLAFFPITTPTHRGTCIPRSLSDRDAEFLTFDDHLHV